MATEQKLTILVVDDSTQNLDTLSVALESKYRVRAVLHAEKALKIIRSDTPPDLMLLDIMMPDIDGLQVLEATRKLYSASELPVIMATARDESDMIVKALKCGANDYVTKPLDLAIVLSRVHTHMSIKQCNKTLADSRHLLDGVLDSTIDAIVCVDTESNLRVFNASAERIFRCSAKDVIGSSIDAYLSIKLKDYLKKFIQSDATEGWDEQWHLIPEGFTAARATGEAFPVEGSIARAIIDDKEHFTLVLRDIEERLFEQEQIKRLNQEKEYLQEELSREHDFKHIEGSSDAIECVLDRVRRVAQSDSSVLITGESGTGKELIARAIHAASLRTCQPLVKVDCGSLPEHLIESELFGHEKGSFTGAIKQRTGRFELANGGTIFLDEIGELPIQLQPKLLRILQDQEFERVGGSKTISANVRVIAATNRDLEAMVAEGDFREDLFYRINVIPIELPALRERPGDIPGLAQSFLQRYSRKTGRKFEGIDPDSMSLLQGYKFPGNVRELQNIIERSVLLSEGPLLDLDMNMEIPALMVAPTSKAEENSNGSATLEDVERQHVKKMLELSKGVIEGPNGAATMLGLNPSTLRFRLKKLGIRG